MTQDGFYTFVHARTGFWTVGASHCDVVGELGHVEYIDFCNPSEVKNARRRALRRARRVFREDS